MKIKAHQPQLKPKSEKDSKCFESSKSHRWCTELIHTTNKYRFIDQASTLLRLNADLM